MRSKFPKEAFHSESCRFRYGICWLCFQGGRGARLIFEVASAEEKKGDDVARVVGGGEERTAMAGAAMWIWSFVFGGCEEPCVLCRINVPIPSSRSQRTDSIVPIPSCRSHRTDSLVPIPLCQFHHSIVGIFSIYHCFIVNGLIGTLYDVNHFDLFHVQRSTHIGSSVQQVTSLSSSSSSSSSPSTSLCML